MTALLCHVPALFSTLFFTVSSVKLEMVMDPLQTIVWCINGTEAFAVDEVSVRSQKIKPTVTSENASC